MGVQNRECVMVMGQDLPLDITANTTGVTGATLRKYMPETVRPDVLDRNGYEHPGVTKFPVSILKVDRDRIRTIQEQFCGPDFSDSMAVDFPDVTQNCKTYDEFICKASLIEEKEFRYLGIGIYGSKKLVDKLIGDLPLLRRQTRRGVILHFYYNQRQGGTYNGVSESGIEGYRKDFSHHEPCPFPSGTQGLVLH